MITREEKKSEKRQKLKPKKGDTEIQMIMKEEVTDHCRSYKK